MAPAGLAAERNVPVTFVVPVPADGEVRRVILAAVDDTPLASMVTDAAARLAAPDGLAVLRTAQSNVLIVNPDAPLSFAALPAAALPAAASS